MNGINKRSDLEFSQIGTLVFYDYVFGVQY